MNSVAVKPLTVGFHETQFLRKLNQENRLGFWFQLSNRERRQIGSPWGPVNSQALNRYSYVMNNPLKYTDPTGHIGVTHSAIGTTYHLTHDETVWLWNFMLNSAFTVLGVVAAGAKTVGEAFDSVSLVL
jgi:hypothetical protein